MLPIQRMISKYNNSSRNGQKIKYLVFHYTGNKGDTAENNAEHFNKGDQGASAHYFVSDEEIYQVVEDYRAAWAVGDGEGRYGITNSNSLNVEMCCWIDGTVSEKTEANTVELVKMLMEKHSIDVDHIVRHYDASRKNCPNWSANNWSRWIDFKNKLVDKYQESKPVNKEESKLLSVMKNKVVRLNSNGAHVYALQGLLTSLGYNVNGIDGNCGYGCVKAIKAYQKDNGLAVDGSFGPASWECLLTK